MPRERAIFSDGRTGPRSIARPRTEGRSPDHAPPRVPTALLRAVRHPVTRCPIACLAAVAAANNTARYLGSSLGVAVTASLMGLGHPATARAAAAGADHAVLAATLLWLLGAAGAPAVRAAQRRVSARYGS
ncbi:hypothetical protein ACIGXI_13825 [Kitasatospora aureofaciens]|uniref:hypothetical protein n=1 Tax=Kitasatospora aureofaciens TaxID=1894 RepID=UPI0037CAF0D1